MSLRWGWSLLTLVMVAVVAVTMMVSITDIEKKAWKASEQEQAELLITLLADELKMPMLAGSKTEVETLISMFIHEVPGTTVFLHWASGESETFGDGFIPEQINGLEKLDAQPKALPGLDKWYAMGVKYNTAQMGSLAMHLPGKSWDTYDAEIKLRVAIVAAVIALLSALLVYMRSGRIVNYLRLLARASKRVGGGDFTVHLPVQTQNEFGKTFHHFNQMVSSLERREKIHDMYGDYQRPQAVADEFDRNAQRSEKSREVTILSIDMVAFNRYLKRVDQDEALSTLNRAFALFQFIVHEFGGHIDSVQGDAMIAVFNHPFELKNHENQAVKAAIAIIDASHRLEISRPDGGTVEFRVGLAIGEVIIGHLGVGRRKSLTILGEPISLASMMAKAGDTTAVTAPYGTMLSLGHGFKQKELGMRTLANGEEARCIAILPGEAYVEQEVEEAVNKAFMRIEPGNFYDDDDEGW